MVRNHRHTLRLAILKFYFTDYFYLFIFLAKDLSVGLLKFVLLWRQAWF